MDNTLDENLLKEFGGIDQNDLMTKVNRDIIDDDNEPAILKPTSYIDLENIEKYINANRDGFTIFSTNIQSANAKFDELLIIVKYLEEKFQFSFAAICLQECWLPETADKDQFKIPDYEPFIKTEKCCGHGGLLTFIHKEYKGKQVNFYKKSPKQLWEGQCVEIKGARLKNKIVLSNIYRPPRFNNNNETINNFIEELQPYISELQKNKSENIVLGDFNLDFLQL